MADLSQPVASKSLRVSGFYYRKLPDLHFRPADGGTPETGASDMVMTTNGKAAFIEVKSSRSNSIDMRNYTQRQREWAVLQKLVFNNNTWLFVEMGLKKGNRRGTDKVKAYLVPAFVFMQVHTSIHTMTHSLPMRKMDIRLNAMKPDTMCAEHYFQRWELTWGSGCYNLVGSEFYKENTPHQVLDKETDALEAWRTVQNNLNEGGNPYYDRLKSYVALGSDR